MSQQGTAERSSDESGFISLDSYGVAWESSKAQERQPLLPQSFFEDAIGDLRTRAERNLDAWQELVEQARRGQEDSRVFAWKSVGAYADFLDSLFFYYRESVRAAERATREG